MIREKESDHQSPRQMNDNSEMLSPIQIFPRRPLLVKEASRRSVVKSDSLDKLRGELDYFKQAAPQALATPAEWRKEDDCDVPPCEIVFDASVEFEEGDSDLESLAGGSCDSLVGSCSGNGFLSSSEEGDEEDDDDSTEASAAQDEEPPVVQDISDAELTRQLRAIQVNPCPSRVQGICQHWHALCTQSAGKEAPFATRLMHQEGMEALLDAMILQKDSAEVQEAICWVLGALVFEDEMFKDWFGECSGIQSVLKAMKSFPENAWVQEAACAALQCLTYNHKPSQVLLHQVGGLPEILTAMNLHPTAAAVQEQGCAALANLAGNNDIRQSMLESKPAILLALQTHSEVAGVQEYGISALGNVADGDRECIQVVSSAMTTHSSNSAVLEFCLQALQNFMDCDQEAAELVASLDLHPTNNPPTLACWIRDTISQHPPLKETGTKLLQILDRNPPTIATNDPFVTPTTSTRKAIQSSIASPKEVVTAFVNLSLLPN